MKKNEILMEFDYKATTLFIAAAIGLVCNSVLSELTGLGSANGTLARILNVISVAFLIFAFVVTIKGFSNVDKASRLSETNENFFMGKNLKILSIVCLIMSVIVVTAVMVLYIFLSSYRAAESLSDVEKTAMSNISIIIGCLLVVAQLTSVAVPYIVYLWKIHRLTSKHDSINNFALLAMLVMVVQLVIGIMNPLYAIRGSSNAFLARFSGILLILKYIILLLFFIARRKTIYAPTPDPTDTKPSEAP